MDPQRVESRAQTYWVIEPRYTTVQFSVKNFLFFTVEGSLNDFAGIMVLDENDLRRSSVEITIKASSIATQNRRRDNHLRSAAFLNAEKYPEIRFQSTKVEKGRDRDAIIVTGTLTIKGRSKEVVLNVTQTDYSRSPQGEEVAYYVAQTKLDRFDFGVSYGRWLIGRKLKVTIQVQATRQA